MSGEKQRTNRGYDFIKVVAWFAERADLIILLFDAHKLDISDELKGAIDVLKGHEDKIRCILNKADQIDRQQLMRGTYNSSCVHATVKERKQNCGETTKNATETHDF